MEKIPESFVCPLTMEIFTDPVVCCDGHTYERSAIEAWFQSNATSPMSNEKLESKTLLPNIALRNSITEWRLLLNKGSDGKSDEISVKCMYCQVTKYYILRF